MAGFPPVVARRIFEREGERCFRCRRPLRWHERGFAWSIHHRRPRGMGGSKSAAVNSVANGIVLCGHGTSPDGCHHWAEKNREIALAQGYLIPGTATTDDYRPDRVRVQRKDKTWWLLTDGGRAVEVEGTR